MGRVVGIGGANVDFHLCSRAPIVLRDSNPGTLRLSCGGVARNISENLARLGDTVSLISAVGDDALGELLLRESAAAGLDMSAVLRCPGQTSSCYAALVDADGDMLLGMSDMGILENLTPAELTERIARFPDAVCVAADPNLPAETMAWLLSGALGELPVFMDPVSTAHAKKLRGHVGGIYCLKPNVLELGAVVGRELSGEADMELAVDDILAAGCHSVAVSMGKKGCFYADRDGNRIRRAFAPVENMADATGAGDAFLAGLIHGWLKGLDPQSMVELGLAAGRIAVQSEGTVSRELNESRLFREWEEQR